MEDGREIAERLREFEAAAEEIQIQVKEGLLSIDRAFELLRETARTTFAA